MLRVYYDIYHFTCFRFENLNTISHILDLIDERDKFIHAIFLLSKTDFTYIFEIHARIIVEKFEGIWQERLFYLTYTFCPILVRGHVFFKYIINFRFAFAFQTFCFP